MSQNFNWSCAAWTEGGTEDDGTVPSMWENTEEKRLYRPPFYTIPQKTLQSRRQPDSKWRQFPIVKVKFISGEIS